MIQLLTEKQKDRVAEVCIRLGGILVILVVLAIVVNIGLEALPLFLPAHQGAIERIDLDEPALAAGSDPRRELHWTLDRQGRITIHGLPDSDPIDLLEPEVEVIAADVEIQGLLTILSTDNRVIIGKVRFSDSWLEGERSTGVRFRSAAEHLTLPAADESSAGSRWIGVTANLDSDGNLIAAAWRNDGRLEIAEWDADDEEWRFLRQPKMPRVAAAAINGELDQLALIDDAGQVRLLQLPSLETLDLEGVEAPVAAIQFLIGGGTLIVAEADGDLRAVLTIPHLEVFNNSQTELDLGAQTIPAGHRVIIPDDEVGHRLASNTEVVLSSAPPRARVVRSLEKHPARPTTIAPGHRDRSFLVGYDDGAVALFHSTSGRRLLADNWSDEPIISLTLDPKGNGGSVLTESTLLCRSIDSPHPEVSLTTLFLPVWYEGYAAPKRVWQSTGGSDSFEPKMSLWPLIFGTLKATLYAMLLSIPLALMAAIYVSQLAPPWLQGAVKPTIELMAAVPSVVVGFLAALWLAPRLEQTLLACFLALAVVPLAVIVARFVWRAVPAPARSRLPEGIDLVVLLAVTALTMAAAWAAAPLVEARFFAGDLGRYLFTEWGMRYDQRNSLVVGIALAFAVIPVIFTIAEDACSAVPKNLITASRALGATRWQTALHLVVPSASPGIFAAVMLGLGRAVGETMIVLMAAGNTPLLDLSPFNGMRTMSAAIAVEIPEAPVGGTLFRVLFLTGTLLFIFTLVLTTAADTVGSYLRKRYARF